MPARYKRFDPAKITDLSTAAALNNLVVGSVSVSSGLQYRSSLNTILAFLCTVRQEEMTLLDMEPHEFIAFLQSCQEQGLAGAEGYRSALLNFQRANGIEQWAGQRTMLLAAKGVKNAALSLKVDKGPITEQMALQFVELMLRNEELQLADLAMILLLGELRFSEAEHFHEQDLIVESTDAAGISVFLVVLRRPKGVQKTITKPVCAAFAERWVHARGQKYGRQGFLFERGVQARFRRELTKAASILNWPEELDYATHGFRVGGAQIVEERIHGILAEFFSLQSAPVFSHYARPRADRKRRRLL